MKLEIGMYVRTKKGSIAKVLGFDIFEEGKGTNIENLEAVYFDEMLDNIDKDIYRGCFNEVFKNAKASHNIIDLIEVGDYVNGFPVEDYFHKYNEEKDIFENVGVITTECYLENSNFSWILAKDIKTILTHEQFENNCFKIKGDE